VVIPAHKADLMTELLGDSARRVTLQTLSKSVESFRASSSGRPSSAAHLLKEQQKAISSRDMSAKEEPRPSDSGSQSAAAAPKKIEVDSSMLRLAFGTSSSHRVRSVVV
jgi:hypothetical protein